MRSLLRPLACALLLFALTATSVDAAIFQFITPVETRKGERSAYLWVPPKAERIRGVVMVGITLIERELAQDDRIRAACAEQQLAIVYLNCGLGAVDIQRTLNDLAAVSGYRELSAAPLMFIGHSAGGPQARKLATAMSDRGFGLVQYRGGSPIDDEPGPAGVPSLMMIGQFDEFGKIGRDANGVENWEKDRDKLAGYRAMNERNLGSVCVEPGGGHFPWSDRNAKYLALFIAKAAAARIPAKWPIDVKAPVALNAIDPATGWLTDMSIKPAGKHAPAPYAKYTGDKAKAAWHFDGELAEANVAYHVGIERKDQFIIWKDPHSVQAGARFFFSEVKWVGDGQTFQVHPQYADIYPKQFGNRGSVWGDAGKPVGHSGAPIKVRRAGGPIVAVGEHRFRVEFSELAPATETARVTFMAYSEGDDEFRYTERVGMIVDLPASLGEGKVQTITFAPLHDMTSKSDPIELKATSDSGLPVAYQTAYGPARIESGKLVIAELPARAKFPVKISVVAYQFGSGVEPKVRPAEPIAREFLLKE